MGGWQKSLLYAGGGAAAGYGAYLMDQDLHGGTASMSMGKWIALGTAAGLRLRVWKAFGNPWIGEKFGLREGEQLATKSSKILMDEGRAALTDKYVLANLSMSTVSHGAVGFAAAGECIRLMCKFMGIRLKA